MARKHLLSSGRAFFLKRFRNGVTARNYQDQAVVFSQGDTADAIFYIHSGTVKLTAISPGRKKATMSFLSRGSFFGEGCLAGRSMRRYTATSIGNSKISQLQRGITKHWLRRDPEFAALLAEHLLFRNVQIEEDLVDHFFSCSERRLARVLLLIDQIIKESDAKRRPKVSQTTLAEMVGTTRGRVCHFMKEFRNKGFIDYNGDLRVNTALLTCFLLSD